MYINIVYFYEYIILLDIWCYNSEIVMVILNTINIIYLCLEYVFFFTIMTAEYGSEDRFIDYAKIINCSWLLNKVPFGSVL